MSKCWYCNNELTSGDSPKHFGICNKCYDKMFKSGDTIIHNLTNKIAELQKQLAEIVEKIKKFIHTGEYDDFGNEYLMSGSSVLEFLDEFLKEYQK